MKTIGIVAHSAEGGSLCFVTACREGALLLGEHMHPEIAMSCVPMALSMPGWRSGDYDAVGKNLATGIDAVACAGADFWICPDNTAHIVLEPRAHEMPIPGIHIADVVVRQIAQGGWTRVGLLGTEWTMTGPVYKSKLAQAGLELLVPQDHVRRQIDDAIFNELCNGVFREETTAAFMSAIDGLNSQGAECVVLGCTEIPLIVSDENSPLPVLDSTRLLAKAAVETAISQRGFKVVHGWIEM